MSVNGTIVEEKMRRFKGQCAHFSFNKCPIYTHDGASAKFSSNSQETATSAGSRTTNLTLRAVLQPASGYDSNSSQAVRVCSRRKTAGSTQFQGLPSLSGFERGGTRVGKRSNPRSEQSGDSLTCPSFLFSLGVH